ncbi:hypothetical protein VNI00_004592 [Paramarasmius palmivorus]|uniref:F-box domain-containing protein n=1 Tax=Paramarasmius palmivorus TaxID=297713 RepID=A0AAW0DFG0_9AGAR
MKAPAKPSGKKAKISLSNAGVCLDKVILRVYRLIFASFFRDELSNRELYKGISHLQKKTRKLQAILNSRAPISRLPSEVLSRIFLLCVPPLTEQSSIRWLAFTHVCHFWRTVSIGNSMIWNEPNFSIPDLAREMIKRSRPSLFDIYFNGIEASSKAISVLLAALSFPSRIRTLDLTLDGECSKDILPLLARPMPSLQSFAVISDLDSGLAELPPTFLRGDIPRHLEHFHLKDCEAILPPLSNLTSLHLIGYRDDHPTEDALYRILRQSPQLKELKLSVDWIPDADQAVVPVISLPNLALLSISYSGYLLWTVNCIHMLNSIACPIETAIEININSSDDEEFPQTVDHHLLPMFDTLSQQFSTSTSLESPIKTLYFNGRSSQESLHLEGWREEVVPNESTCVIMSHECVASRSPADFSLRLEWSPDPQHGKLTTAAMQILPPRFVSTLDLTYLPEIMDSPALLAFLDPFLRSRTLGILMLQGPYSVRVLEALTEASIDNLAVPSLRTVTLAESSLQGDTVDTLVGFLRFRITKGAKLSNISFHSCRTTHSVLVRIEALVEDMDYSHCHFHCCEGDVSDSDSDSDSSDDY